MQDPLFHREARSPLPQRPQDLAAIGCVMVRLLIDPASQVRGLGSAAVRRTTIETYTLRLDAFTSAPTHTPRVNLSPAMAAAGSKRRSTRQAANRKRSPYVDPDTEDDFSAGAVTSDEEADYAPREPAPAAPPRKKRKLAKTHRPQTRSKAAMPKPEKRKRQTRLIGHKRKPRATDQEKAEAGRFKGPSDGKIPDWTALPFAILRDVFIFASRPLDADRVSWLHKAAHTCRAFAEPALEAYYESPPMLNTLHPHHLLELMSMRRDRYINYNTKVKRLEIDMRKLSYTASGKALFDLNSLVVELPQLHHLEIINPIDSPPFRRMKTQQWWYPDDLAYQIETHGLRLKTWRWSRDMLNVPGNGVFQHMANIHEVKSFQTIERLVLCGFDAHDSISETIQEDMDVESKLDMAWAISKLPNIKDLAFVSCDVVSDDMLQRLPAGLERLEFTNCWKLNSDMLREYLLNKGSELRELVLNHNVTTNLAFLPVLKYAAPKLEVLKMDGHYYSERVSINDAEPEYKELMTAADVPTWPSSLRHLELVHLQKWSAEAAVNLFRSLVDGASDLPNLRHINIQAHINIPWRDRAGFRDQWIDRINRVYLRKAEPPNPYHGSKRQFELYKRVLARNNGKATAEDLDAELHPRRISHIEITPHKPEGDTDAYSDIEPSPIKPTRRSTRVAQSHASVTPSDEQESESEETGEDDAEEMQLHVQGLCDVVDVSIDNQRPRENLYTERDFLDSEISGDEDWNEGADMEFEDNRYAW